MTLLERDYVKEATRYAHGVIGGDIGACRWVQRACQRQLDDLKRYKGKSSPFRFNPLLKNKAGRSYRPADNICAFIEHLPQFGFALSRASSLVQSSVSSSP